MQLYYVTAHAHVGCACYKCRRARETFYNSHTIMDNNLLRENPELMPFLLSNVQCTGTAIGIGAYGRVDEVGLPVIAAAKTFLHDPDKTNILHPMAVTEFVKECQLMSTLRHPNIVKFLGICFFPESRLPALVMERLLTNLHDLLEPKIHSSNDALKSLSLSVKCSMLHDIASGLAYLHERPSPIVHRDLSARNVPLSSEMVAKIADLGTARVTPHMRSRAATTMSMVPGAAVYMLPEALEGRPSPENDETSINKNETSIDIFSFGVVAIFLISQTFPCELLAPTYLEGHEHKARTELRRRNRYMEMVYQRLRENHPLIQMIEWCLDFPKRRPSINEVMGLLDKAIAESRDEPMESNKLELAQILQDRSKYKVRLLMPTICVL